ncbi:MAG: general stress protein [Patescibacteria group bacterium]|nr:general stress protein [Patescibacteria group bacterium]MDE2116503.1 general stress protein [Patescibacteria group bacterium]
MRITHRRRDYQGNHKDNQNNMATSDRGFASMDPEKRKEIASKGGKAHGHQHDHANDQKKDQKDQDEKDKEQNKEEGAENEGQ